jgi:dTDP-glucose 4,6-dehydratase/UDP-glucuronate decarboxylase
LKALVAGGAGFVGSHTCRALLEEGHEVVCVDNLITGARENIAELEGRPDFTFVEADVAKTPWLDVDVILHLASPASPVDFERMPIETMAANSLGTWQLLELAAETGARLTFASTSEVYGDPLVHPQAETYWGNVDPIGPRSCYDESKRFGEALLMSMRRSRGVQANIVRFFNTYGPRMRRDDGRAIPELVTAALEGRPLTVHGDGTQTRSFCYVSDLVGGLLLVALDPILDGEVFNIGNPAEVTIRELAERIRTIAGSDSPIHFTDRRPGDPERRRPDIAKIRDRYGWEPTIGLEDGLAETIATVRDGILSAA